MSTPTAGSNSKATPRLVGGTTPSASTPLRSVPSPAQLASVNAKTVNRSPWRGAPSPFVGSHNVQTPTPSGNAAVESSPAAVLMDRITSRARSATIGNKSAAGSPAAQTPAAFSGLGLTLAPFANGLGNQQLNDTAILNSLGLVGRDNETWTTQRVKEIVDLLGTKWGLVSQENVKRCVDRIGGLECYWEDHPGGKEKIGERRRTLAIAGNEMVLEIGWTGEKVTKVLLNFMRANEETVDEVGAEILRKDLVGSDGTYLEIKPFVENLSRLARIDQLGRGKVSCFEALDGVGSSLKKLWELELAKEQKAIPLLSTAEIRVLCERSGRPMRHVNGTIGLRLDYWLDQRFVAEQEIQRSLSPQSLEKPYSLLIDCESFDATQYPPIRTSQAWLSATVADAIYDSTLPRWDEPPPTFIPGTQIENVPDILSLGVATTGTQPDVRFVARLKPAIILPLAAAMEILTHMEPTFIQGPIEPITYLGLLFPDIVRSQNGAKEGKITFTRSAASLDAAGNEHKMDQKMDVFVQPDSWARTITEVPFSHPCQLVDILQYLRQWAFFGRFLQRSFISDNTDPDSSLEEPVAENGVSTRQPATKQTAHPTKATSGYQLKYQHYEPASDTDSEDDQETTNKVSHSMSPPRRSNQKPSPKKASSTEAVEKTTEISFTYAGIARRVDMVVSVVFSATDGLPCICVFNLQISLEAKVEVSSIHVTHGIDAIDVLDSDAKVEYLRKRLERVVRITEDIGATITWLQTFLKQSMKV